MLALGAAACGGRGQVQCNSSNENYPPLIVTDAVTANPICDATIVILSDVWFDASTQQRTLTAMEGDGGMQCYYASAYLYLCPNSVCALQVSKPGYHTRQVSLVEQTHSCEGVSLAPVSVALTPVSGPFQWQ